MAEPDDTSRSTHHTLPHNNIDNDPDTKDSSQPRLLTELLARTPPSHSDQEFLSYLLAHEPEPMRAAPRLVAIARPHSPWRQQLMLGGGVALVVLLLVGIYVVVRAAMAVNTIQHNLQVMQLPTIAATATLADSATGGSSSVMAAPATRREATSTATNLSKATTNPAQVATTATAPPRSPTTAASISPTRQPTLTPLPTEVVRVPVPLPPAGIAAPTATLDPALPPGARPQPALVTLEELPPAEDAVNVLLLGIDQRPEETFPARTDAIVVVRLEPQRQRVAMLSLERDLMVQIPGYGQARLNAANVHGELYAHPGGGIELTRQTVSSLLDLPIHYVVKINFQGFIGAIDALGGVTIDVEEELYDPQYPTMDYGYTVAHFLPGPQHMDGARALMYSRVRHMDSNFARMRRQQQVMVALLTQVREQHALDQLQDIADLTTALRDYIQTDMPPEHILSLGWAFRDLPPEAVERYVLDENMVSLYVLPGDPYAAFAVPGAIDSLVQQLVHGPALQSDMGRRGVVR